MLDPVSYPHISISGETYEVMFRVCDVIDLMKIERIDIFNPLSHLVTDDNPKPSLFDTLPVLYTMLEYGLKHTEKGFTREQLMREPFADHGQVNTALAAARSKAWAWASPAPTTQAEIPATMAA